MLRLVADAGRSVRYLDDQVKISDGPKYGAVVIS